MCGVAKPSPPPLPLLQCLHPTPTPHPPLWQAFVDQQVQLRGEMAKLQQAQEKENELQRGHEEKMANNCKMQ